MTSDFLPNPVPHYFQVMGGKPSSSSPKPKTRLATSMAILVLAADALIYDSRPGLSIAVMGSIAIFVLAWNRPREWWDAWCGIAMALLAGSLLQSVIEVSFSNLLMCGTLFSLLMVDSRLKEWDQRWAALPIAIGSWLRSLGRWPAVLSLISGPVDPAMAPIARGRQFWRITRAILPALLLMVPFLLLMSGGNAVAASYLSNSFRLMGEGLGSLQLPTLWRVLFWMMIATGSLTFLWPSLRADRADKYLTTWRTFQVSSDVAVAQWRTWLILGLLNLLFLWVNLLDARFLWLKNILPDGVSYSGFVHDGVWSLIGATVLSAVTLTWLFQQSPVVSRAKTSRYLALLWIVQNLVLISGVYLRLARYVDAYQLTVLRVGVAAFLALNSMGFALLAWKIIHDKSLNWLLLSNGIAVFALFYTAQFLDVAGYVAQFNTQRWMDERLLTGRSLDVDYLRSLGPAAWKALDEVFTLAPGTAAAREAGTALWEGRQSARKDWRSWQWKESTLRKEVFSK